MSLQSEKPQATQDLALRPVIEPIVFSHAEHPAYAPFLRIRDGQYSLNVTTLARSFYAHLHGEPLDDRKTDNFASALRKAFHAPIDQIDEHALQAWVKSALPDLSETQQQMLDTVLDQRTQFVEQKWHEKKSHFPNAFPDVITADSLQTIIETIVGRRLDLDPALGKAKANAPYLNYTELANRMYDAFCEQSNEPITLQNFRATVKYAINNRSERLTDAVFEKLLINALQPNGTPPLTDDALLAIADCFKLRAALPHRETETRHSTSSRNAPSTSRKKAQKRSKMLATLLNSHEAYIQFCQAEEFEPNDIKAAFPAFLLDQWSNDTSTNAMQLKPKYFDKLSVDEIETKIRARIWPESAVQRSATDSLLDRFITHYTVNALRELPKECAHLSAGRASNGRG